MEIDLTRAEPCGVRLMTGDIHNHTFQDNIVVDEHGIAKTVGIDNNCIENLVVRIADFLALTEVDEGKYTAEDLNGIIPTQPFTPGIVYERGQPMTEDEDYATFVSSFTEVVSCVVALADYTGLVQVATDTYTGADLNSITSSQPFTVGVNYVRTTAMNSNEDCATFFGAFTEFVSCTVSSADYVALTVVAPDTYTGADLNSITASQPFTVGIDYTRTAGMRADEDCATFFSYFTEAVIK